MRVALHEDVASLSVIWQELMDMHERTDERFALAPDALFRWRSLAHEVLDRDDGFLLVAERRGQLAGFCLGWLAKNPVIYRVTEVGFVSEIAVTASARRHGVGRALISAVRDWFRKRGVREFQLSTAVWNLDAQAFWKSLGGDPLLLRYRFQLDDESEGA